MCSDVKETPLETITITQWRWLFILCLLLFSQACFQISTSQKHIQWNRSTEGFLLNARNNEPIIWL